jgi:hypothetical protein
MMRLVPLPRRHRVLWLIAAVLAFSAWGSWLAATGRTPDYADGFAHVPLSTSVAAPVSRTPGVPDVAELLMTSSPAVPRPTAVAARVHSTAAGSPAAPATSAARPGGSAAGVAVSPPADLAAMTDPLAFARAVTRTVLTFSQRVDLAARTAAVMAVAALPPIGSPSELAADLTSFDPDPVTRYGGGTITFIPDAITPSPWAAARLDRLGLPAGSFAIDVTGNQLVTYFGHQPVSVAVTVGITGACPPALTQCEIDRIFPRTVAQELGS